MQVASHSSPAVQVEGGREGEEEEGMQEGGGGGEMGEGEHGREEGLEEGVEGVLTREPFEQVVVTEDVLGKSRLPPPSLPPSPPAYSCPCFSQTSRLGGTLSLSLCPPFPAEEILGPVRYESEGATRVSVPGVVTGLAWKVREKGG